MKKGNEYDVIFFTLKTTFISDTPAGIEASFCTDRLKMDGRKDRHGGSNSYSDA